MSFLFEVLIPAVLTILFGFIGLTVYGAICYYTAWEDPGGAISGSIGVLIAAVAIVTAMSVGYKIEDWAAGNMDWSDVAEHAKKIEEPKSEQNFQQGWVNGEKEVV